MVDTRMNQIVFPDLMKTDLFARVPRPFRHIVLAALLVLPLLGGCAIHEPEPRLVLVPEITFIPIEKQETLARFKVPEAAPLETPDVQRLRAAIDELFSDPRFASADLSIGVVALDGQDSSRDALLYARNIHRQLVPASTMKLFTTAAALEILSPEFQFQTRIEATGPITGQALLGDLVIRGSGDPTISARHHGSNPYAVFRAWAQSIKDSGISTIQGGVVGDASLFSRFRFYPGWELSDLPIWYAAQTDALSYNENCIKIFVDATAAGSPVSVKLEPATSHVRISNNARTGARNAKNTLDITRIPETNVIEITGVLPSRYPNRTRTITVDDPAGYFVDVFATVLQEAGITFQTPPRVERRRDALPAGTLLHTHTSPRLSRLVDFTNKESSNHYAEQLLLATAASRKGHASRESAAEMLSAWMGSMGVSKEHFRPVDGSGLSRENRVSAQALLTLLRYMHRGPNAGAFKNSLPVAGVDGTLRRRMGGTPASARTQAKTGFMRGVSSLAGYAEDAMGRPLAFVVMFNGRSPATSYVKDLENQLCGLLRQYGGALTSRLLMPGGKKWEKPVTTLHDGLETTDMKQAA